jgi:hypothetical protein
MDSNSNHSNKVICPYCKKKFGPDKTDVYDWSYRVDEDIKIIILSCPLCKIVLNSMAVPTQPDIDID